jgi:hypothetical protein
MSKNTRDYFEQLKAGGEPQIGAMEAIREGFAGSCSRPFT